MKTHSDAKDKVQFADNSLSLLQTDKYLGSELPLPQKSPTRKCIPVTKDIRTIPGMGFEPTTIGLQAEKYYHLGKLKHLHLS